MNEFVKFRLEVSFHLWDMTEIEVVKDGKKKLLTNARLEIKLGGKLIFIEHGVNRDEKIQRWQDWVAPIWKIFGGGCHLNRDIKNIISSQPFVIENYAEYSLPKTFSLVSYTYEGMATKDESHKL